MEERRKYARFPFKTVVTLSDGNTGYTSEICQNGFTAFMDHPSPTGIALKALIRLPVKMGYYHNYTLRVERVGPRTDKGYQTALLIVLEETEDKALQKLYQTVNLIQYGLLKEGDDIWPLKLPPKKKL